ncbi:hypothetical protein Ssi03_18830 [Sphaerisporangium siamense]|uniref:Uncharacterized protein n=1 Tax=Sphaerisporangium siamense TaxID=795645 RepID=A0A7W7DE09_9ACTN|nr:hypothetical protein [Sphaerisporangium siamense]MBB4705088.1 hypothetical protein [Sphaerisporangium siamense]GII83893.1 hypothetical protein Ssi03_18830 [Sphaerisporangium siamense]
MRRLRNVLLRILCVVSALAAGLTAAGTSARAAVPDRWGFAVVDVQNGVPDLSHQAGSWAPGPTVTVTPGAVGQVYVKFPQIGIPSGGVVHVTAITQTGQWCQVQKYTASGPDEIVAVRCYKYGGTPQFTPFSIVFSQSTGLLPAPKAFGYLLWTGAAIGTQYNSAGGGNTVTPLSTGVWRVRLPGLGSAGQAGGFQATAVNPDKPARCKVSDWTPLAAEQVIIVRCHNATNVPADSGWTLTYQRERAITGAAVPPKNFGYIFDTTPANPGPYTPVPPAITYNSLGSFNEIQGAGTGLRLVTFHKVGVLQDDVQATAYGPGPEYCNLLAVWATFGNEALVRDVACYNGVTRVDRQSFVTYVSAF